jgi:DNA end-binding protein Ku
METKYFHDELVPVTSLKEDLEADVGTADKRQVALAQQLIESLSAEFEPKKYKDHHRERLQDIIEKKAAGKKITVEAAPTPAGRTSDLLVALEASLAKAKKTGASKKGK